MSLSDRIRPNSEAAPWVVEEVKQMEARIKRLEEAWIPASTKPEGYERRVLLWVVWQGFGWIDQPEAKIGWWKHGPGCFAFDEFENADHLVTHWMEIADPTQAKEAKPRHPQSSERRCAVIQFRTLTEAISAAQQGSTVCWKTGAYQLRQDKNGKWFVHCSITNDWASLFWADGVTSSYKPEDFFNAGSL